MLREIFKQVKDYRRITGKAISEATGISQNHISEYIRGNRNVTDETLGRMIDAMDELSPGAKKDFGLRLAGCWGFELPEQEKDWQLLISNVTASDMEQILLALADRWSQTKRREKSTALSA